MTQGVTDAQRIMGQVAATAMLDEAFRARLEAAPLEVFAEFGMVAPHDLRVEFVTDPAAIGAPRDADTVALYIPDAVDLTEEELGMVFAAIASCQSTQSTLCTVFTLSTASTSSSNSTS